MRRDSFFRFLPRLSRKTVLSELDSGQRSILRGMKVVFMDSKRPAIASMTESMVAIK
jgi:hypothetical protein